MNGLAIVRVAAGTCPKRANRHDAPIGSYAW